MVIFFEIANSDSNFAKLEVSFLPLQREFHLLPVHAQISSIRFLYGYMDCK